MILKALPYFGLIVVLLFESATSQENGQTCQTSNLKDHLLGITRKVYQEEILPGLKADIDAQVSTCQDDFARKISTNDQEWTSRFQDIESKMDEQTQITNEIKSGVDQCQDNKDRIDALESTVALLRRELACQSCSREGTEECDTNGQCNCKPGFDGLNCGKCDPNPDRIYHKDIGP